MKKPIDPNLERFEDSVFSLTGGDDTPGVSYRAPQFEMKETSAAATPGEYHASENHRQRAEATGAPVEPAPGGEEHHHHHHHGHDADEVFVSWGMETHKKFTTEQIEGILKQLENAAEYGMVLRAKGYVASQDAERWIHFDYVPGESDIREGGAMITGRVCVIGSKLNESAIASLFGE